MTLVHQAQPDTSLATVVDPDSGLTAAELAELQGDLDCIRDVFPIWRFRGDRGCYVNKTELKDREFVPDQWPPSLSVIILAICKSQAMLRTDAEKEAGTYSEVLLCSNNDRTKLKPRINPKLSEAEAKAVMARGAGVDCASCILARPKPEGTPGGRSPDCSDGFRALAIGSDGKAFIFSVSGLSKVILDKFLGENFKNKNLPTLASEIILGREFKQDKVKNQTYYVVAPSLGQPVDKSKWKDLMILRRNYLAAFESAEEIHDEPVTAAAPPQTTEAQPATTGETVQVGIDPATGAPLFDGLPEDAGDVF